MLKKMLSNIYSWLNGEKGPEKNIFLNKT